MCCPVRRRGAEISTSVIITSFPDLDNNNANGLSYCETIVKNSKGFNARKINFVVTINAKGGYGALQGGYFYKDGYGRLVPASSDTIARFTRGLQRCFKYAVNAGRHKLRHLKLSPVIECIVKHQQSVHDWWCIGVTGSAFLCSHKQPTALLL